MGDGRYCDGCFITTTTVATLRVVAIFKAKHSTGISVVVVVSNHGRASTPNEVEV